MTGFCLSLWLYLVHLPNSLWLPYRTAFCSYNVAKSSLYMLSSFPVIFFPCMASYFLNLNLNIISLDLTAEVPHANWPSHSLRDKLVCNHWLCLLCLFSSSAPRTQLYHKLLRLAQPIQHYILLHYHIAWHKINGKQMLLEIINEWVEWVE